MAVVPESPLAPAPLVSPAAGHAPQAAVPLVHGRLAEYAELPPFTVLRRLESAPRGLDEETAQGRLPYGDDGMSRPRSRLAHLARTAADPFVIVLVSLSVVSAVTRDPRGAVLIFLLAVLSCVLRFRQEHRSDRATAALRAMVTTTATVLRRATARAPSVAREVPVDQVAPGDIVQLNPGDLIPADLRLLSSSDLRIGQAVLTGESLPADKHATWSQVTEPYEGRSVVFDHPRLCFMGTSVVSGTGTAVAVATGTDTYFGAIHRDLPRRPPETAFDRGVRAVSWTLVGSILAAIPIVLIVGGLVRGDWPQSLLFAVSVAVAITPEMLPLIVTAALIRGTGGLARSQILVKRLPAVHNMGAMDTLCTDKTGTLTQDRVSLTCRLDPLGRPDPDVLRWACVNAYWSVELTDQVVGDAIDEALLEHAHDGTQDGLQGIGVIPFDFSRRRATVVVRRAGSDLLITKGSPEDVLAVCSRVRVGTAEVPLDAAEHARLTELGDRWASDGVRLLAVATRDLRGTGRPCDPAHESNLTLIGFVGFRDEPDPEAETALTTLAALGVRVIVITGDHPLVARRICQDAGLAVERVVLGRDVDALGDAEVAALATSGAVFARVEPPQKARIVRALQSTGRTVGYLGDGVNDAPALRAADVGISVTGAVDLARESADVILVRKDLRALEQAVLTGRRTFANTVKYMKITAASSVGNVISIAAASALLPFLPMLPLQVLVQNLCFDLSQLPLVYDHVDPFETRRPRTFDLWDLARFVVCLGPVGALLDLATFGLLWWALHAHGSPAGQALFHTGWLVENLLTQALALCLLRSGGRRGAPGPARAVVIAAAALSVVGLLLPFSPLAGALSLHPLPLIALPALAAVLAGYCIITLCVRRLYVRAFRRWL